MDNNNFNTTNETFETVVTEAPATENTKKPLSVLGLISMICGILSIILSCCCTWLCIPAAIAAVILAIVERSKTGKFSGFALAGLICGALGFLSVIVNIIISAVLGASGALTDIFSELGGSGYDYYDSYYYY